jgi:hypothetical protein
MQRSFEPMRKQVEAWQQSELTDVTAKVVIYEAFVEAKLEAPKHLCPKCTRSVLRAEVRRLPAADDLESVECIHIRVQGTRPDSPIQGDGEIRRVPGSEVLAVVLDLLGCARPGRSILIASVDREACPDPIGFPRIRLYPTSGLVLRRAYWRLRRRVRVPLEQSPLSG